MDLQVGQHLQISLSAIENLEILCGIFILETSYITLIWIFMIMLLEELAICRERHVTLTFPMISYIKYNLQIKGRTNGKDKSYCCSVYRIQRMCKLRITC